ncbi:MAG: OmpH family outer membrane protein [Haliscomenobacter sp.]|nr:OmpH family outer membrane protein [Haliscomenobacter sp.]MBK7477983.1 OmpH family outer membrane protein [Haliscomenobacter sp.]MBK8878275.1 OmpH family outer membrane protein [Haliscomenobacter sp.]
MKTNIALILSSILLVAVGYLFFAQNQGGSPSDKKTVTAASASSKALNIVFVNSDTLLEKYVFYQDKIKALDLKSKDAETALQARGRALEREFLQAQQKVQQGLLAPNQVQQEEQRLMQKQQSLVAEQEKVGKQLLDERQKLLTELEKKVKDLLEAVRKEKGYDYILNYGPGTGVLMVNDSLDITPLVLERLNQPAPAASGDKKTN